MKKLLLTIALFVFLFHISGCAGAQVRSYSGPELTRDKIALLHIPENITLVKFDGKQYKNLVFSGKDMLLRGLLLGPIGAVSALKKIETIEILPGHHQIEARYEEETYTEKIDYRSYRQYYIRSNVDLLFNARAGHEYRIGGGISKICREFFILKNRDNIPFKLKDVPLSFWIDDLTTDERYIVDASKAIPASSSTASPSLRAYKQKWDEGGTLYHSTVKEWNLASYKNRLAATAYFVASLRHFDSEAELKAAAVVLERGITKFCKARHGDKGDKTVFETAAFLYGAIYGEWS